MIFGTNQEFFIAKFRLGVFALERFALQPGSTKFTIKLIWLWIS